MSTASDRSRRPQAIGVLLAVTTLSCSFVNQLFGGGVRVESIPPEQVAATVQAFDPADLDEGFESLNQAALLGEPGSVQALEPLLQSEDPTQRWAAAYVASLLAESAADVAVLSLALDDSERELRWTAAGSLIGLGHKQAIPVLIEAIGIDDPIAYAELPQTSHEVALAALQAYTGQSFSSAAEWRAWWDGHGERLTWDGAKYVEE